MNGVVVVVVSDIWRARVQRASEAFWGFSVRVRAWVWIWLWVWVEEGGCGDGGEGEGDGGGDSWERTSRISSSNYTIKR